MPHKPRVCITDFITDDLAKSGWVSEAGNFEILVGSSSRDIRLQDTFHLAQTTVEK